MSNIQKGNYAVFRSTRNLSSNPIKATKRNKIRSVPMPTWTKKAIDEYASVAVFTVGILFRQINKGNRIVGERMSEQAIYNLVIEYSVSAGVGRISA